MDVDRSNNWLELVERGVAWVAAATGVVALFYKRLVAFVRALRIAHGFGDHFGVEAAATIYQILKSVERSQSESEIRHRIVEAKLGIGVYICDPQGRCTWCNEFLAESFGRDREQMLDFGWLAALDPSDADESFRHWAYAVEHGLPYRHRYRVINRRSGLEWLAETEAVAVTHGDQLLCYVGWVVAVDTPNNLENPKPDGA